MITLNPKEFAEALSKVKPAIDKKSIVPILDEILVQIHSPNLLKITATDLTHWGIAYCGYQGEGINSFTISPDIISILANMNGIAEVSEHIFGITQIACGKEKLKVTSENAIDFPRTPDVSGVDYKFTMPAKDLYEAFKDHKNYASDDDLRPAMKGLNINKKPDVPMQFASTDGHVLLLTDFDIEIPANNEFDYTININLPLVKSMSQDILVSAKDIIKETDDVKAEYGYFHVIDSTGFEMITRIVEERYPDYRSAIPENYRKITLSKDILLKSFKKGAPFTNKTTNQIVCKFKESTLNIIYRCIDYSREYSEEIPCSSFILEDLVADVKTYSTDEQGTEVVTLSKPEVANEINIGFNHKLFGQILTSIKEDSFDMYMSEPNRAAYIKHKNKLALLMPVMITEYNI